MKRVAKNYQHHKEDHHLIVIFMEFDIYVMIFQDLLILI